MKACLVIRNLKDRKEVARIPVDDMSERQVERAMLGMLRNMDTDKYFIDDSEVDKARKATPEEETR